MCEIKYNNAHPCFSPACFLFCFVFVNLLLYLKAQVWTRVVELERNENASEMWICFDWRHCNWAWIVKSSIYFRHIKYQENTSWRDKCLDLLLFFYRLYTPIVNCISNWYQENYSTFENKITWLDNCLLSILSNHATIFVLLMLYLSVLDFRKDQQENLDILGNCNSSICSIELKVSFRYSHLLCYTWFICFMHFSIFKSKFISVLNFNRKTIH